MRVSGLSGGTSYSVQDSSTVRDNLSKLAEQHRVSVDDLVKSAEASGPDGPAYLTRALNLKRRLDKLEGAE